MDTLLNILAKITELLTAALACIDRDLAFGIDEWVTHTVIRFLD